ncbi:MAG: hypothetical protein KBD64_02215 [Gammaproteobacteria bacterium]|nr:hypothetical protein [Gammaproteobacteria bacterium]
MLQKIELPFDTGTIYLGLAGESAPAQMCDVNYSTMDNIAVRMLDQLPAAISTIEASLKEEREVFIFFRPGYTLTLGFFIGYMISTGMTFERVIDKYCQHSATMLYLAYRLELQALQKTLSTLSKTVRFSSPETEAPGVVKKRITGVNIQEAIKKVADEEKSLLSLMGRSFSASAF